MPHDERKCIIIGAGVAGISAAIGCALAGKKVMLFEQNNYIGGRARSFTDDTTGEIIDNGQHLFMGCYTSLLFILQTLGTDNYLKRQPALYVNFVNSNGECDTLDTSHFPGKVGVALGIINLKKISWISKYHALKLALDLQLGRVKVENYNAQEFLEKNNQTTEMIDRFWAPIILATLNATPKFASAALFIEVLRRAFFGGREASQLIISSVGLSVLFDPLHQWLSARGGEIILSTRIDSLHYKDGVIVSAVSSTGIEYSVDCLILAVPPKQLLRLLPQELQTSLEFTKLHDFTFSPIVSVYLWFDRSFFYDEFVAMLGTKIQWIFNRRRLTHTTAPIESVYPEHLSLTVSAGDELVGLTPEKVVEVCIQELKAAFPDAKKANLLAWKVIKEKSATFLATPAIEKHRPLSNTSIPNFFIAGDWTATGLPATLEGAAQSGFTAAKSALFIKKSH